MDLKVFTDQLLKNFTGSSLEAYQIIDDTRRATMFVVLMIAVQFALFLAGHGIIMAVDFHHQLLHFIWGNLVVLGLCLAGIMFGGWTVHAPFLGMLVPNKSVSDAARTAARPMVSLLAYECIVNLFLCGPDFLSNPDVFYILLAALPPYFLVSWLAGKKSEWNNWVTIIEWYLYITVGSLIWQYIYKTYFTALSTFSGFHLHLNFTTMIVVIAILYVANAVFSEPKSSSH